MAEITHESEEEEDDFLKALQNHNNRTMESDGLDCGEELLQLREDNSTFTETSSDDISSIDN